MSCLRLNGYDVSFPDVLIKGVRITFTSSRIRRYRVRGVSLKFVSYVKPSRKYFKATTIDQWTVSSTMSDLFARSFLPFRINCAVISSAHLHEL